MSTEYRRGIPSTAHVEAATRLGLLWGDNYSLERRWHFEIRDGVFHSNFESPSVSLGELRSGPGFWIPPAWVDLRPIRPDGMPVDWEVLDQEVARVGQGQPSGFRADLWRRICEETGHDAPQARFQLANLLHITYTGLFFQGTCSLSWREHHVTVPSDILARWTVYQELKPLYDLVDGGEGEVAMPRDVEAEYLSVTDRNIAGDRLLIRDDGGLKAARQSARHYVTHAAVGASNLPGRLANFATVLDAVAERRVAERMRGQTQAPTVTPAPAQPEPRRFADVRPDRHGWRWWRLTGRVSTGLGQRFETRDGRCRWLSAHADAWFAPDTANPQMLRFTVIPTDEQGNPVSWEAAGFIDVTLDRIYDVEWVPTNATTGTLRDVHTARIRQLDRFVAEAIQAGNTGGFSIEPPTPPRSGQFSNDFTEAAPPLTPEGLLAAMQNYAVPSITVGTSAKLAQTEAITTLPLPLPRFTTDELDDVDHAKTTKLDEVTLRRGKLPTVEQIAKYREVRAKRTGGTVADALKESRIDCEVAQYVLERWAGGLGDEESRILIETASRFGAEHKVGTHLPAFAVDSRIQWYTQNNQTLDTAEKPSPTVQRERQEAEERRQRLAELRQRLAAERAAQPQEMAKDGDAVSRFDLIEPDPQADPTASIRAWEARRAAAKVHPVTVPPRIVKPAAAPRRPAIEVVDAEVDGLSRSEAFAALFGRALNGGC